MHTITTAYTQGNGVIRSTVVITAIVALVLLGL
jgi:hypothetical protein